MKRILFFTAIIILTAVVALAEIGEGCDNYKVVDGDSLECGNTRIRLEGIDAPEYLQECYDKFGIKYRCGINAQDYLQSIMVGKIKCNHLGKDRYKRYLSECFNGEGLNVNRQMVISGWAISYNEQYEEEELTAQKAGLGVWQGKFMRPELYRALNRAKDKRNKNKKR